MGVCYQIIDNLTRMVNYFANANVPVALSNASEVPADDFLYRIFVGTDFYKGSGTDGDVFAQIIGDGEILCVTGSLDSEHIFSNQFERGRLDAFKRSEMVKKYRERDNDIPKCGETFTIRAGDYGTIEMAVMMDANDGSWEPYWAAFQTNNMLRNAELYFCDMEYGGILGKGDYDESGTESPDSNYDRLVSFACYPKDCHHFDTNECNTSKGYDP